MPKPTVRFEKDGRGRPRPVEVGTVIAKKKAAPKKKAAEKKKEKTDEA